MVWNVDAHKLCGWSETAGGPRQKRFEGPVTQVRHPTVGQILQRRFVKKHCQVFLHADFLVMY